MIKPACISDVDDIRALVNEIITETTITFTTTPKTDADVAELIETGQVLVARDTSGTFLGYGAFGTFRKGDGYADTLEHTIALASAARGQGIGRVLMATLTDVARDQGAHSLIAGISAENDAGIAFHEACGFQHVGRVPGAGKKFGRRIDLVLMQLIL